MRDEVAQTGQQALAHELRELVRICTHATCTIAKFTKMNPTISLSFAKWMYIFIILIASYK